MQVDKQCHHYKKGIRTIYSIYAIVMNTRDWRIKSEQVDKNTIISLLSRMTWFKITNLWFILLRLEWDERVPPRSKRNSSDIMSELMNVSMNVEAIYNRNMP